MNTDKGNQACRKGDPELARRRLASSADMVTRRSWPYPCSSAFIRVHPCSKGLLPASLPCHRVPVYALTRPCVNSTTSSSAPAAPAACSPTACPPTGSRASCCSRPAARTTGSGSTSRSATSTPSATRAPTGATRPSPTRASTAARSATRAARVLGGCSSINAMIYMRGQKEDYDHWASLGNPGWSWDEVLPLFQQHGGLRRTAPTTCTARAASCAWRSRACAGRSSTPGARRPRSAASRRSTSSTAATTSATPTSR